MTIENFKIKNTDQAYYTLCSLILKPKFESFRFTEDPYCDLDYIKLNFEIKDEIYEDFLDACICHGIYYYI